MSAKEIRKLIVGIRSGRFSSEAVRPRIQKLWFELSKNERESLQYAIPPTNVNKTKNDSKLPGWIINVSAMLFVSTLLIMVVMLLSPPAKSPDESIQISISAPILNDSNNNGNTKGYLLNTSDIVIDSVKLGMTIDEVIGISGKIELKPIKGSSGLVFDYFSKINDLTIHFTPDKFGGKVYQIFKEKLLAVPPDMIIELGKLVDLNGPPDYVYRPTKDELLARWGSLTSYSLRAGITRKSKISTGENMIQLNLLDARTYTKLLESYKSNYNKLKHIQNPK